MSKLPISICIIGKNEERFLEGCLQKLEPFGFEIVFVDTGSTDKTREIACRYTDKVYDFEWINDFAAAKNFCESKATNDWILSLDCDEYVQSMDLDVIAEFMKTDEKMVGSFMIENLIRNGDAIGRSKQKINRMYNRKYCHFEGMIHEQIRYLDGSTVKTHILPIEVLHYGYALSPEELEKKNQRNISLILEELKSNPNEPYYYFQLGQSYAVLDDYEKVFQYLHKGLELGPDPNQEYVQHMLIDYGNAMLHTGRYEIALNLERMYELLEDYSDYLFMMGKVYFANQQPMKALELFVKATMAPKTIVVGTNSFFPLNSMALIYDTLGETKLAEDCRTQVEKLVQNVVFD